MKKRGQLTLIIIIGIVILAVVVLILFLVLKGDNGEDVRQLDIETRYQESQISQVLIDCLDNELIDAIMIIGIQGGYYNLPNQAFRSESAEIAYGYDKGSNTLVSINQIEEEISEYLKTAVLLCYEEDLFFEDVEVSTEITENEVIVEMTYPIEVKKDTKIVRIDRKITDKIQVNLFDMHKTANEIIEIIKNDPEYISISKYPNNGFEIEIMPYSRDEFVYNIIDKNQRLKGVDYVFRFGVKI